MSDLRLHLIQFNPVVGDIAGNVARIERDFVHATQLGRVDLVVVPECALTGYPLQDLVTRPGFLRNVEDALDYLEILVNTHNGSALLVGSPITGIDLPFNGAVLFTPHQPRQIALKTELPNSDVFDERRTFAQNTAPAPLVLKGWNLGVMICEDMWHPFVANSLAEQGAEILLVINGSPMETNKQPVRIAHARDRVADTNLPLIYLNLIGGQDELVFDGASFAIGTDGQLVFQCPALLECVSSVHLEKANNATTITSLDPHPITPYPDVYPAMYGTLVTGLRDYINKNGFTEVVIGLSGGLDSAIVTALAVDAIGPERVIALMMPAKYTGDESKTLASDMSQRLGIRYASVAIADIAQDQERAMDQALQLLGNEPAPGRSLACENIQARARGALLMSITNARPGALVLSTGNKSEMSVGYATLYGDMCGGFNPIKDLYKTQVQALCAWRNDNLPENVLGPQAPIPTGILTRPPSAELAPDQTDEKALGAYPMLDAVLDALIEDQLSPQEAAEQAHLVLGETVSEDYARKIASLVKRAEYKRRQSPPGIKISRRSFGMGWRYPITNRSGL